MSSRKLKRFLSIALSFSMILSLNTTNFASEINSVGNADTQVQADADEASVEHQHTWSLQVAETEATCLEEGKGTFTCEECGEEKTDIIPATGHSYEAEGFDKELPENYVVTKEATCTEAGIREYTCTNEGCTEETEGHVLKEEIPAAGHVFENGTCTVCQEAEETEAKTEETAASEELVESKNPTDPLNASEETVDKTPTQNATPGKVMARQAESQAALQADTADTDTETPPTETEKDPTKCDGENHVYTVTPIKEASCTASGIGRKVCQCGKNNSFIVLQPRHTYQLLEDGNPVVDENGNIVIDTSKKYLTAIEETCTSSGLKRYKCEKCTQTYNVVTAPKKHSFEREEGWPEVKPQPDSSIPAYCGGTPGKNVWECDDCDYVYEEEVAPSGQHNYVDTVIKETCETPRCTLRVCGTCGEVDPDAEPVPITGEEAHRRLGHSFEATTGGDLLLKDDISDGVMAVSSHAVPTDTKPATCLEDGYATYTCTKVVDTETGETCGKTYTVVLEARGSHEANEIAELIPPTCTENAKYVTRCKYCNEPVGEVIDALDMYLALNGNDMDAAIAAAKDAGEYQLGHNWVEGETVIEGSCTETGISTFTCSRCNDEEMREVPARHDFEDENHNLKAGIEVTDKNKLVIYKEPTCTEDGVAYCTCEECGTRRTDIVIPATGHDYGEVTDSYENYTDQTDDGVLEQDFVCHDGKAVYTCKNGCGHSYTVNIPAKPHTPNTVATIKKATCTEPSTQAVYCTVCGDATSNETIVGPKLGHTYEVIENGEVKIDADGNIVINENTTKPVTADASCTQEGTITYTCTREITPADGNTPAETCGETHVITIPKTPHNANIVKIIDPTCQENAKIEETCDECNTYSVTKDITEVYSDEEITALDLWKRNGHEWVLDTVFSAATCTRNGIAMYTCKLCGETENRTLKAHHAYMDADGNLIPVDKYDPASVDIIKAADCENDGIALYTCTADDCAASAEGHVFEAKIEKLGHEFDDGVVQANTEKPCQPGTVTYTCQRNGCTETEEESLPELAQAHIYVDKQIQATCTEPAKTGKFCQWCDQAQPGTTPTVVAGSNPNGHTYISDEENGLALTDAEGNTVYVKQDGSLVEGKDYTVVKEAKCTETGTRTYKCATEGCENEITLTVPALGHDMGEWDVKRANCTDPARRERSCTRTGCQETEKQFITGSNPVENAHEWLLDEGQEDVTCGEVTYTCKYNPEHTKTEQRHDWGTGTDTTQNGNFKIKTCSVCGETEIDATSATAGYVYCDVCKDGVQPRAFGGYDATCDKAGKTDKEMCPNCGKTFKEQEDIPATGHEYEWVTTKELTCVDGLREEKCKNCGNVRSTEVIKPAEGEDYDSHQFENGECSVCHSKDVIAATRIEAGVDGGKNVIRIIADAQLIDDSTYTVVQRGVLYYTAAEGYPGTLLMEHVGNVDKVRIQQVENDTSIGARITINIGTATTRTVYGRAYVVIKNNTTKAVETRYGDVVSGSFESLGGGR